MTNNPNILNHSLHFPLYLNNGKENVRWTFLAKGRECRAFGLYEYGQRYYAPWLCRFVSVDPIAEDYPQLSSYNYAGNKPITSRDIEGLQSSDDTDNSQMQTSDTVFDSKIQIPKGSITHQTKGGEVLSFTQGGKEFWFDPSIKWYTTLNGDNVYDVTQFSTSPGAPRFLQVAFKEFTADGGFSEWDGIHWNRTENEANFYSSITVGNTTTITASRTRYSEKDYPEVGTGESMIPVWGSGKQAYYDFKDRNYGWAAFNSAMAVSDVFLLKSIGTGLTKGGIKMTGSHSWNATRKYYLKKGFAKPNQPLHHWVLQQNQGVGKHAPKWLKNQMWNLKPFSTNSMHIRAGHGLNYGRQKGYGAVERMLYGTPNWFKVGSFSIGGRILNEVR